MDPFSQIIGLLRPQALYWSTFEAHNAWTISFNPSKVVVFGQLIEGACRVTRSDGICFDVTAGDFMLMPLPPDWTMAAGQGGPPIDFTAAIADPGLLLSSDPDPEVTRFIAGNFIFDATNSDLVAKLILPIVHVRGSDVSAGRLRGLLQSLGDEAMADRPGKTLILSRLLEVMLIEALRNSSANLSESGRGLLAGLADPKIGRALYLMHEDARQSWTVATLAREVAMSRSAFAALFMQMVGVPPMDYLANWRMTLARTALMSGGMAMADIAEQAGYQSVSAFSTAFKRVTGCSPTAYVQGRQARSLSPSESLA
jgi:AraC-like DNA-binding protein